MSLFKIKKLVLSSFIITISYVSFSQEKISPFNPRVNYQTTENFKQKAYNFLMSKKLKAATAQRDSIYFELLDREEQIKNLKADLKNLKKWNDSLLNTLILITNKYEYAIEEKKLLIKQLKNKEAELEALNAEYQEIIASSLEKNEKLNKIITNKEKELANREARLKQLERIIKRQDTMLYLINKTVKNALINFTGEELSVRVENGKVYVTLSDRLLFASGSAKVEEKGKQAIKTLADFFGKTNTFNILVEGHTDNVPIKTARFQDNWALSTARATNIVRMILKYNKNIDPERLTVAGRSKFNPIADNAHALGKAKNRRTEIILIPNLEDLFNILSAESTIY